MIITRKIMETAINKAKDEMEKQVKQQVTNVIDNLTNIWKETIIAPVNQAKEAFKEAKGYDFKGGIQITKDNVIDYATDPRLAQFLPENIKSLIAEGPIKPSDLESIQTAYKTIMETYQTSKMIAEETKVDQDFYGVFKPAGPPPTAGSGLTIVGANGGGPVVFTSVPL